MSLDPLIPSPYSSNSGLYLFLEAGDPFAVGGDQRLLCFNLGDNGFLGGDGREGDTESLFHLGEENL